MTPDELRAVQEFDEENISPRELFKVSVNTFQRIVRLETTLAHAIGLLMALSSDTDPGERAVREIVETLQRFVEEIEAEAMAHQQIKSHLHFMHLPE